MKTRIDFPGEDGGRLSLRFEGARCCLVARRLNEVVGVVAEAERHAMAGHWVAGFVAYEAALAFDAALAVVASEGCLPLAMFAVYDAPMPPNQGDAVSAESWRGTPWRMDENFPQVEIGINAIRAAIAEGEYYQINYTGRLRSKGGGDGAGFFEALRLTQPNGYCAHFEHDDWQVLSVSPELFFDWRVDQQPPTLTTKPMKGTAPRHASPEADAAAATALRASMKDRAENVMIVDLLRNDMARVAVTGSVEVPKLFEVEGLPTAWQMTSTVQCATRPNTSLVDVFRALFPCGSVTGAPKVAAMAAIAALEPSPRGAYCGAIGLIRPGGHATFNVGIRTVTLDNKNGTAECGLGSGITWESSVFEEYAEWLVKRRFLLRASAGFELFETLRLEAKDYTLLERHLSRLQASAEHFGFPMAVELVMAALEVVRADHCEGAWRVRLVLDCHGGVRTQCTALDATKTDLDLQVMLAKLPVDSADEFLRHKSMPRTSYDVHELAAGFYDVLLWNERDEITEFTRGNVVVELNGKRLTPMLHCGLLAGTLRAEMLARGEIEEAVIHREDLQRTTGVWFINSVRGMLAVRLTTSKPFEGNSDAD
ncbi:MAG: chorismate-binding protein [Rhodocyclaceae bacterium]|nr:chorismate-binding protein [Rhodocyclaceae bacterium]